MAETPSERVFRDHDQVNILFADGFGSRQNEFEVMGAGGKVVCITCVRDTKDLIEKLAGPGVFDVVFLPGWLDHFEDWSSMCDAVREMDIPPRAVILHCYDPDRAQGMMKRLRKDRPDLLVAHIPWDPEVPSNHVVKSTGVKYR